MSAFSNGTEWEAWSSGWCNRCVRDADIDSGGCPHVLHTLTTGDKPDVWTDDVPLALGPRRYTCSEFRAVPE